MKHLLVLTRNIPGALEVFIAACGYESENKKEFAVSGYAVTWAGVTCPECRAMYGHEQMAEVIGARR